MSPREPMTASQAMRILEGTLAMTLKIDDLIAIRAALGGSRLELSIDAALTVHVREPLARLGASVSVAPIATPRLQHETDGERLGRELEETNARVRELAADLVTYFADAFTKLPTSRLNALLFLDLVLAQKRLELDTMIRNLTKTEIP